VTDAIALLGDRYTLPIVRELHYGNRRFSALASQTGAPRSLLSGRLDRLERAGVITRSRYQDHPPRADYLLTESGRALLPALIALKQWGDRHCRGGEQTAIFTHACGAEFEGVTVCRACGEPLVFEDLRVTGGSHPPRLGTDGD